MNVAIILITALPVTYVDTFWFIIGNLSLIFSLPEKCQIVSESLLIYHIELTLSKRFGVVIRVFSKSARRRREAEALRETDSPGRCQYLCPGMASRECLGVKVHWAKSLRWPLFDDPAETRSFPTFLGPSQLSKFIFLSRFWLWLHNTYVRSQPDWGKKAHPFLVN